MGLCHECGAVGGGGCDECTEPDALSEEIDLGDPDDLLAPIGGPAASTGWALVRSTVIGHGAAGEEPTLGRAVQQATCTVRPGDMVQVWRRS